MDYEDLVPVSEFRKKLTQIKDTIESLCFWMFIFFVITLLFTRSVENRIIEKIENHEKTIINEIRKVKSSV